LTITANICRNLTVSFSSKRGFAVDDNEQVLTIDELATYLKASKSTLYKLLSEGKIPGQKVG